MLTGYAYKPTRLPPLNQPTVTRHLAAGRQRGVCVCTSPARREPCFLVPTISCCSSWTPSCCLIRRALSCSGRHGAAMHAATGAGGCTTTTTTTSSSSSSSSSSTDSNLELRSPPPTADGGFEEELSSSCSSADSFEEDQYQRTVQAGERQQWAEQVRGLTGGAHPSHWLAPDRLDPPAILGRVVVVLVGPKKPATVGSVARSCSCFEVGQMRLVSPRCDPLARSSRSVSKGAQYVLYQATQHASVAAALEGVAFSVAFTRWVEGAAHSLKDLPSLLGTQEVQMVLGRAAAPSVDAAAGAPPVMAPAAAATGGNMGLDGSQAATDCTHSAAQPCDTEAGTGLQTCTAGTTCAGVSAAVAGSAGGQIALVFGREDFGLSDEEVAACSAACSIPIGRLQESLSVAHAVSIVLSQLFQYKQGLADHCQQ